MRSEVCQVTAAVTQQTLSEAAADTCAEEPFHKLGKGTSLGDAYLKTRTLIFFV